MIWRTHLLTTPPKCTRDHNSILHTSNHLQWGPATDHHLILWFGYIFTIKAQPRPKFPQPINPRSLQDFRRADLPGCGEENSRNPLSRRIRKTGLYIRQFNGFYRFPGTVGFNFEITDCASDCSELPTPSFHAHRVIEYIIFRRYPSVCSLHREVNVIEYRLRCSNVTSGMSGAMGFNLPSLRGRRELMPKYLGFPSDIDCREVKRSCGLDEELEVRNNRIFKGCRWSGSHFSCRLGAYLPLKSFIPS